MAESDYKSNALRLLAENWQTPRALAEQIYILDTEQPDAGVSATSSVAQSRLLEESRVTPLRGDESGSASSQPGLAHRQKVQAAAEAVVQAVQNQFTQPQFTQRVRAQATSATEQQAGITPVNITAEAPGAVGYGPVSQAPVPRRPLPEPFAPGGKTPLSPGVTALKPYSLELPPKPWEFNLAGGGASTTQGFTVDGPNTNPLQVQLYSNGSQLDPDQGGPVTVNIAQLDPEDVIPDGVWITGIYQDGNGNFEAQIPVWLQ